MEGILDVFFYNLFIILRITFMGNLILNVPRVVSLLIYKKA